MVTRLEEREVPALYAVGLLSPTGGDVGQSSATFAGGIALNSTLPTQNGKALVDAATPTAAIQAALMNTITATVGTQSANYSAGVGTIGTTTAAQTPFVVSPAATAGQFTLRLEDLATMPGMPSDWDYDDRTWTVIVELVPPTVWLAPGAAPSEAGPQAGWFVVHRSFGGSDLTVNHSAPTGTATPEVDFTGLGTGGGSVTFVGDELEKLVLVNPINDTQSESAETVTLSLLPGSGYTLATPSAASLTIFDDESNTGSGVTATADTYSTVHGRQLYTTGSGVLGNDSSTLPGALSAVLVSNLTHGTLNEPGTGTPGLSATGAFVYTPESGYVGPDTFSYYATDGVHSSPVVTVNINVTNQAPTAAADAYSTTEDGVLVGGSSGVAKLLANDSDPDGDGVQSVLVSNVQHGGLDLRGDGTFTYAPDANFAGTDTFTYYASDGIADSSPVTVTITVQPRTGIDLDGRDVSTNGQWKGEAEEARTGIAVSVSPGAEILARAPVAPAGSGWQLLSRKVTWDSSLLTVGGNASGVAILPLTGDQILSVSVASATFAGAVITYAEAWMNAGGTTTLIWAELPAKPLSATLTTIDFTSDHGVLLDKGGLDEVGKNAVRFD